MAQVTGAACAAVGALASGSAGVQVELHRLGATTALAALLALLAAASPGRTSKDTHEGELLAIEMLRDLLKASIGLAFSRLSSCGTNAWKIPPSTSITTHFSFNVRMQT